VKDVKVKRPSLAQRFTRFSTNGLRFVTNVGKTSGSVARDAVAFAVTTRCRRQPAERLSTAD
jgi:hypothetical protein